MRLNYKPVLAEAGKILGLAWPVVLTSLNWTLMHMIDVAIVGHSGPGELGALAAGRALTFVTIVIGIATLSGIIVFTARFDGAGERHRCGDVLRQGIICALLLGLPTGIAMYLWADTVTRAIGIAPEFTVAGARVVQMMALAYPAQLLLCAMSYFLEGASRPARAMIVNLVMLPLNALLAWAWVEGRFGLPAAGAVGAVSATACISLLGMILMAFAIWTLPDAQTMRVRAIDRAAWRRAFAHAPALIRFGIVPGIAAGLEMAGFSLLITLSTRLGSVATDAFQAVFSLHNLIFALAIGMASAAGVRAGNAVGEGNPRAALPRTLIASALLAVALGLIGAIYMLFAPACVALFSDRPEVRTLAASLLRLLAPFMLCDGLQLIFVYALRSIGDQVAAGINGVIAFFLVTGGLAIWLVVLRGEGPNALVVAAAAGMVAALLLQGGRFYLVSRAGRPKSSD